MKSLPLVKSPEYNSWANMKSRCLNKNHPNYKYYGDRGISIDERWLVFKNFAEDMGFRPTINHTLERIDNDKGYSKENCKWATRAEQSNNNRKCHFITYQGKKLSVAGWARELGIKRETLQTRLYNLKWDEEKALTYGR